MLHSIWILNNLILISKSSAWGTWFLEMKNLPTHASHHENKRKIPPNFNHSHGFAWLLPLLSQAFLFSLRKREEMRVGKSMTADGPSEPSFKPYWYSLLKTVKRHNVISWRGAKGEKMRIFGWGERNFSARVNILYIVNSKRIFCMQSIRPLPTKL